MPLDNISTEQRQQWINEAKERFQACFTQPEKLVKAIIDRGSLIHSDPEHNPLTVDNLDTVLDQLTSTYVVNSKIRSLNDMEALSKKGYHLCDPGRYDQTLIDRGIISKNENHLLSFSDRIKFNAAAFSAIGPEDPSGIHAYNARYVEAQAEANGAENDPVVLAIVAETKAFEAALGEMLKDEMKKQLEPLHAAIQEIEQILIRHSFDGHSVNPTLRIYAEQLQHEILNDQSLSVKDKITVLNAVGQSIKPAESHDDQNNRLIPIMQLGADMLNAKKNERLGRWLIGIAAVIIIIASITLAILSAGSATPMAIAGIMLGVALLTAAMGVAGATLKHKGSSALINLSITAHTKHCEILKHDDSTPKKSPAERAK